MTTNDTTQTPEPTYCDRCDRAVRIVADVTWPGCEDSGFEFSCGHFVLDTRALVAAHLARVAL
jgi:hypothetical protein